MASAGEQIGETIVRLSQENADLSREVERLQAYAKDTERAALKLKATLEAEIARLQSIVDALPKTADGVPIVPGMTLYAMDPSRRIMVFELESWLEVGEHCDIPTHYCSTRQAAEKARDA